MPLPCFSSWLITDLITSSGLCSLKSRESMSVENTPILRSAKYDISCGGCCNAGKRKNGATFPPPADDLEHLLIGNAKYPGNCRRWNRHTEPCAQLKSPSHGALGKKAQVRMSLSKKDVGAGRK